MWTLRVVVLAIVVAGAGCEGCSKPNPATIDAPGNGSACTTNAQCMGLVCVSGFCALPGSVAVGGMCSASRDCMTGLFCSVAGTCTPAGAGDVGAACSSGADCKAGLACVLYGFSGTCAMPGTKDLGDACTAAADCIAGLVCGSMNTCEPPLVAYPPFAGVTCAPDLTTFGVYFEVPRSSAKLADFYRLPFPDDIRVKSDGTLDLADFPRPGKSFLGVDLVDLYATALQQDFDGFSTVAPVTFRMTSELDFNSINGGANLHYVDITDSALPNYGVDISRGWSYDTGQHKFECQHAFVVGNA